MVFACSAEPPRSSNKDKDGTGDTGTSGFGDGTGSTGDGTGVGTGSDTGTGDGTPKPPVGPQCEADPDCPAYLPFCLEGLCVACLSDADCGANICFNGTCLACNPGQKLCSGNQVVTCNDNQSGFDILETCPADGTCNAGQCFNCYPSTKKCVGGTAFECKTDGSEWVQTQDCSDAGLQCLLGVCLSPCGADFKANTNAGCGFFAVDLDNAVDQGLGGLLDAWSAQFAVVVSNTSETLPTEVTVSRPDGVTDTKTVQPRSLETFLLPSSAGMQDTGKSQNSFRIDSDQPITVYQFNPLSNEGVFSNDASVLLPAAGLGNEYYAMSHRQIDTKFRGFVTVVGISEAITSVTITPAVQTLGGAGIPAITAWDSYTFELAQGEVVNIESDQPNGDLTGTHVKADGPVAVFSGHEAAVTSDQCCADHLEQQMVPVTAWGSEYIMTRSMERGIEKDWFRVLAAEDGTTVQFNPAVTSPPVQVLQAGGFIEFSADTSFTVKADKPIMVAQFLASSFEVVMGSGGAGSCFDNSDCPNNYSCFIGQCMPPACGSNSDCPGGHTCFQAQCAPVGDPALILGVPVQQWRESYVFLTPNSYANDYINIVAETGAGVTLDGNPVADSSFEAIGGSTYRVYRTEVEDGVHTVVSEKPVSVIVYGYDKDVSYGYPGGVGLSAL